MKRKNEKLFNLLKELPIGTVVDVGFEMEDCLSQGQPRIHEWQAVPVKETYRAIVVGATWVCDGKVEEGSYYSGGYYDPPEYEPAYLSVSKKTPVLLVRRGMFNKQIKVPIGGVKIVETEPDIPLTYMETVPISERVRRLMSEDAKNAPRDKKGRFVK